MNNEDERGLLPSERSEKQEQIKKQVEEQRERQQSLMREDFGRTFQTAHGKRVLAWMMQRSGFAKVILSADATKSIDAMATTFAAMELNFYLEIRRHIPIEVLQQVEYGGVNPSGTSDNTDNVKRTTSKSKSKKKG